MINTKIYKYLFGKYGGNYQLDKLTEECAELIVAIQHMHSGRIDEDKVLGELADVQICLETAKLYLNSNGNYNRIYNDKMVRIKQREGLV